MMNYCKKQSILFTAIFSLVMQVTFAQEAREVLELAQGMQARGEYALAFKEYQRALFFQPGLANESVYMNMGDCCLDDDNYGRAIFYFDKAISSAGTDSAWYEAVFHKSMANLRAGHVSLALHDLNLIPREAPLDVEQRKAFYQGVCYFATDRLDEAEEAFIICLGEGQEEAKDKVHALFDQKKLYRPSPATAMIFSMILPGSGQVYTGHIEDGVNSLLLTGGLAVLAVVVKVNYSLLDAAISVAPWFLRYYQGGIKNSYEHARDKQKSHRVEVYQEILDVVKKSK